MFERYTEKARRVIFFARIEASEFGSAYIESEHLLLGLLREDKALSARLFESSSEAVDKIRKLIEGHSTPGERISTSVDMPLSSECKRILNFASEEAEGAGHDFVGTEHLLAGMLRERDSYAAWLLNQNGVDLENARALIAGKLPEEGRSPPKSPGIPANSIWQQLLYNPASDTIIVEMKGPAHPPLPAMGRLFMRHKNDDVYEQIGAPKADVSYQNPVTCQQQPVVLFNSIRTNKARSAATPDGVYAFNLRTRELTVSVAKNTLSAPAPYQRCWISALTSLSVDGQTLYMNVGVEKPVVEGVEVEYYLASLNLPDNKLELLSPLKDIRF